VKILHRARGWHAVWTGWRTRRVLPGDTPELVGALHALNDAGLLQPNSVAGWDVTKPCPRCGRETAADRYCMPSVCTGCRAELVACDPSWDGDWNRAAYRRACEE
jgi:hypothetical protein